MTKKAAPRTLNINLDVYEPCIQWVKTYMLSAGYEVTSVRFDPYLEMWYFYDSTGLLVMRLTHDLMDCMWSALRQPVVITPADIDQWR